MMMHAMPLVSNIKNKQNLLPPTYLSSEPIYLVSCMKYKIEFIFLLVYRTSYLIQNEISIIKLNGESFPFSLSYILSVQYPSYHKSP